MAPTPPSNEIILDDVRRALREDLGDGDRTAELLPAGRSATARIVARESCVLAGAPWAEACFRTLDPVCRVDWRHRDGESVAANAVVLEVRGEARALLSAERSAINFLQTLSGTATATRAWVGLVAGTRTRVLDTRKTLPGLRLAQKYAVRCGGGHNHRIGLFDAVLIKENHIAAAGSIAAAIAAARTRSPGLMVEVEVENLRELDVALAAMPDRIMLDDFDDASLAAAVARTGGRVPLEVSGGLTAERVRAIAGLGVDFVSVGALTKHVRAIDFSMRIVASD